MKILFDHQVFSWQKMGGISRYFAEIIRGATAAGHDAFLPENFYSSNTHLEEILGKKPHEISPRNFKGKTFIQNMLGRAASRRAILEQKPDVFHPTYFDDYFLQTVEKQRVPFVLTVHDMIHEKFRHGNAGYFSIDKFVVPGKKLLAERAAAIIAVSENTRADLLEIYPKIDPKKVHVVWHGNSLHPDFGAKNRLNLPDEYILFVGSRGGYKNFDGFLAGVEPVLKNHPNLKVVFAGGKFFTKPERKILAEFGIFEKTILFPWLSDADLTEIYRRALCFVFPSKYEGFGIPVLESWACGCPCILNRASSLPEVGGDAAVYFSESERGSLTEKIEFLVNSKSARLDFRRRGFERLKNFDWNISVKKHLEIYKNALFVIQ